MGKLTTERLRQIVKGDEGEAAAMAAEILTLRDDLAKAYHQHQFFAGARDAARTDRDVALAARDDLRVAIVAYLRFSDLHRGDDYFDGDRRAVRMVLDDALGGSK